MEGHSNGLILQNYPIFFSYNCLFFMKDSMNSTASFLSVVGDYERVSGQKINIDKSSNFFASQMAAHK